MARRFLSNGKGARTGYAANEEPPIVDEGDSGDYEAARAQRSTYGRMVMSS